MKCKSVLFVVTLVLLALVAAQEEATHSKSDSTAEEMSSTKDMAMNDKESTSEPMHDKKSKMSNHKSETESQAEPEPEPEAEATAEQKSAKQSSAAPGKAEGQHKDDLKSGSRINSISLFTLVTSAYIGSRLA